MNKGQLDWRKGIVKEGDQIGRTLGFPTANLDANITKDVRNDGVYSSLVIVNDIKYAGAVYIGPRLVLGEKQRVLEINILDFEGDLYDNPISFALCEFIRGPKNFPDKSSLVDQLQQDVSDVRASVSSFL